MEWEMIYPGRQGVRKLAASFATVHLRKRGLIKKKLRGKWTNGARRWTEFEFEEAIRMRRAGMDPAQIATKLRRTEKSVTQKLGYSFLRSAA